MSEHGPTTKVAPAAVPVSLPSPSASGDLDPPAEVRRRDLEKIISVMAPAVEADGGELVLVDADVDTGVVVVELRGACSSCAVSAVTLSSGVERILKQRLSWVTEVRGGVENTDDWEASAERGSGSWQRAERPKP